MTFSPNLSSTSASLEQFGKNLPDKSKKQASDVLPGASFDPIAMGESGSAGSKLHGEDHLEEVFGEVVAAQVGTRLDDGDVLLWLLCCLHYFSFVKELRQTVLKSTLAALYLLCSHFVGRGSTK